MRPSPHDEARQGIGAWVLGACPPDEGDRIARHVGECAECELEGARLRSAMHWIGTAYPLAPPAGLRQRLLDLELFARRIREAYAGQVAEFTSVLAGLSSDVPVPRHRTVGGLVAHLARNDRDVLRELRPNAAASGWRTQADEVVTGLAAATGALLRREVRLAGAAGLRRPMRDGLVQRVFETWTHTDDLRAVAELPERPPSAAAIQMIVDFGVRLLPVAMERLGRAHPGMTAVLVLTGPGAGRWVAHLAHQSPVSSTRHGVTVIADAVAFCRLMAGRRAPADFRIEVDGDVRAAADLIQVAATLGCD